MSVMLATTSPHILTVPEELMVIPEKVWTVQDMKGLATKEAKEHGLNVRRFLKVIERESGWDRFAIGDNGLSHGLAQLYYPTRDWGIATSSAYDPEIALEIMASAWENGLHRKWSAWVFLYGN